MKRIFYIFIAGLLASCQNTPGEDKESTTRPVNVTRLNLLPGQQSDLHQAQITADSTAKIEADGWLSYELTVPVAGRYRALIVASSPDSGQIWLEDYINNPDDRQYNITGYQAVPDGASDSQEILVDGIPLNEGIHPIKIHARKGRLNLHSIRLQLLKKHRVTPTVLEQKMALEGTWDLVWSEEFDYTGHPDTNKWLYNIGDWGWGNNELQYYTEQELRNAEVKDGYLTIRALKDSITGQWTSARLTTQGKVAFRYGKIEFRAKVPVGRGVWAAGWTLGDRYRDELSWPYCGEIDVLECVGYEIDDATGDGQNHASCHTPKYYFKKGNQITGQIPVSNMHETWHNYTVEWYPDVIYASLDGERYFTYNHNKDSLEWPFHQAQNIILNLAVGGGWGGAQGLDSSYTRHDYQLDYVRVYQKL